MDNHLRSEQELATFLLDHESLFPHDQPIINFTSHQLPLQKKTRICAWNQPQDDELRPGQINLSPSLEHQKQRIEHFLSTIRFKNCSFSPLKSFGKNHKKSKVSDNPEGQKNDIYLPLNNTLITFPKSRSQCRKLQNEQKLILQKLYRKRQKSKIIPKQISINPATTHQILKPVYPSKNYLSKNRSFIQQIPTQNSNAESRPNKEMASLKKKYTSSYYKKISGVFQLNLKSEKSFESQKNKMIMDRNLLTFKEFSKKINSLDDENIDSMPPLKLFDTIYSSPRFNRTSNRKDNDFSIERIKENAKNSHLNRKISESNGKSDMHLMGSTITKWRVKAQQKMQKNASVHS